VQVYKVYNHKNTYVYRILEEDGIYDIVVANTKPENIKSKLPVMFTIFANKNDLNLLLPDFPLMNSVPIGQTDKYEYFVEKDCRVFVEAFTCGGKISVSGTTQFWNIQNENYEVSLTQEANSHIIGILDLKPGTFYFGVKGLYRSHDSETPETNYVLKIQEFPAGEAVPYEYFFQPNH
jgi:hypothetical protein